MNHQSNDCSPEDGKSKAHLAGSRMRALAVSLPSAAAHSAQATRRRGKSNSEKTRAVRAKGLFYQASIHPIGAGT
eukprot:1144653-Pelagomonas_calceolata.AAC.5